MPGTVGSRVTVNIPAALRQYWGGAAKAAVDAKTLGEALGALGPLTSRVLDDAGGIRRHVNVFLNQTQARDLEAPLADGDIIHILPAVSGG